MSSLSYGTWISSSESESIKPKKRIATYDKPSKQESFPLLDVNDLELNLSATTNNLNEYTNLTEKNQSEIHDLLDQMNKENFDNETNPPLIKPIAPPILVTEGKEVFSKGVSNYHTIYNQGTTYNPTESIPNIRQGISSNLGSSDPNRFLLEKLNYMIYLLEQQQNEKTKHVLEEFLLYCFLGVFMIYIVDGFARSGASVSRYTR